ncbi:MAG: hypothetical protein J6W88_00885 [Bacteroidales bacterium]|nr:hypothetical protein [Bacteroidales bacterium]
MRKSVLVLLLLLSSLVASAQLVIPGTGVTFSLKQNEWLYMRTLEMDGGAEMYLYCYTGKVVVDQVGDTVLPFLRIYVNSDYAGDVYELAYERYMQQPFQSVKEYTQGIGLPRSGGLGYEGAYTNPTDQKDYRFMMTYFKDRGAAVEFRLETTKDTYDDMLPVFKSVMSSLK